MTLSPYQPQQINPFSISPEQAVSIVDKAIANNGDLSCMTEVERKKYYLAMCHHLGLDPFSNPFNYIETEQDGKKKIALYPNQRAADQLRKQRKITVQKGSIEFQGDVVVVTAIAVLTDGSRVEEVAAAPLTDRYGKQLTASKRANAIMKASTGARRRAILAACGVSPDADEDSSYGTHHNPETYDPPMDVVDLGSVPVIPQPLPPVTAPEPTFDNRSRFQQICGWTGHAPSQVRAIAEGVGLPTDSSKLNTVQAMQLRDELFLDWGMGQNKFGNPFHARNSYKKVLDAMDFDPPDDRVWQEWSAKVTAKPTVSQG